MTAHEVCGFVKLHVREKKIYKLTSKRKPSAYFDTFSQTFPAEEGWLFPCYNGACGRYVVVENGGKSLPDFYNALWGKSSTTVLKIVVDCKHNYIKVDNCLLQELNSNDYDFSFGSTMPTSPTSSEETICFSEEELDLVDYLLSGPITHPESECSE